VDPVFRHALAVVRAVGCNDYVAFQRMHHTAPLMSAYWMDILLPNVRRATWNRLVVSYRPSVPWPVATCALGFYHAAAHAERASWDDDEPDVTVAGVDVEDPDYLAAEQACRAWVAAL
jgi:hypothetical protein